MQIILKSLSLLNFKGARSVDVEFSAENFVYGKNESGKTTLLDAYLWLLFGKDSSDRSDSNFQLKTLDANNQPIHRLEHEVKGVIQVGSETIELRKVFREKWQKKKGSSVEEFTGHEKEFYWNEVPLKESSYMSQIASLIDESLFKLVSNVNYFNQMKWQERRSVLMQMAGKIDNGDILDMIATIDNKTQIMALTSALNQKKTIDQFKAEISAKKSKINDELRLLPSRIDEAQRNIPDAVDLLGIEENIKGATAEIEQVERFMMDRSLAQKDEQKKVTLLLTDRQNLKSRIMEIEFSEKSKVKDRRRKREQEINDVVRSQESKQMDLKRLRSAYKNLTVETDKLLELENKLLDQWGELNKTKLEFNTASFSCPTCKRPLAEIDIENKKALLLKNFNEDKSIKLSSIVTRGEEVKAERLENEKTLDKIYNDGVAMAKEDTDLLLEISGLKAFNEQMAENESQEETKAIASNTEYQEVIKKIEVLNEKINAPAEKTEEVNNDAYIMTKRELQLKIDSWRKTIATQDIRKRMLLRIDELMMQEDKLSQELASLEGIEFAITAFIKTQMDELEKRINGRFQIVKFKLFEEQINGGEKETCVTLINGVPYPDANTAAKIQAGLDIINGLSQHFNISAPVWIDNRESVTDIPETNSQIINLIVSPTDKYLKFEVEKRA